MLTSNCKLYLETERCGQHLRFDVYSLANSKLIVDLIHWPADMIALIGEVYFAIPNSKVEFVLRMIVSEHDTSLDPFFDDITDMDNWNVRMPVLREVDFDFDRSSRCKLETKLAAHLTSDEPPPNEATFRFDSVELSASGKVLSVASNMLGSYAGHWKEITDGKTFVLKKIHSFEENYKIFFLYHLCKLI